MNNLYVIASYTLSTKTDYQQGYRVMVPENKLKLFLFKMNILNLWGIITRKPDSWFFNKVREVLDKMKK